MAGTNYTVLEEEVEINWASQQSQQLTSEEEAEPTPHEVVASLTEENLALHSAHLQPDGSEETPAIGIIPLDTIDAQEGIVRTLGADDPTVAARRSAYLQRKNDKASRKRSLPGTPGAASMDSKGFLSNLPEVEADVQYRFTFVVVGAVAIQVAQGVCNSAMASSLPKGLIDNLPESDIDPMSGGVALSSPSAVSSVAKAFGRQLSFNDHRCLCPVTAPLAGAIGTERLKLAKLVFRPMNFGEDSPPCRSRQEALSSCVVFLLTVDPPLSTVDQHVASFEEQLQYLSESVERMRSLTRAKHRPVRAVVLCYCSSEPRDSLDATWPASLADFEQAHGHLWKFGPVRIDDGDALHTTFTEMASIRIVQNQLGDGSGPPGMEEAVEEEGDDAAIAAIEEQEHLEQELQASSIPNSPRGRASSEASEGWQRPPVFETEFDGSECSDGALDLHAKVFGVESSRIQRQGQEHAAPQGSSQEQDLQEDNDLREIPPDSQGNACRMT